MSWDESPQEANPEGVEEGGGGEGKAATARENYVQKLRKRFRSFPNSFLSDAELEKQTFM